MKKIFKILGLILVSNFFAVRAVALEMPAVAATCIGCHGVAGVNSNPLWPNLAAQKKDYLSKQLQAFKGGQRFDSMMSPLAKGLSEKDINELASYFSTLGN